MINTEGTVLLECQTNDQRFYNLQFHVVNGKVQPLLGLPDCLKMDLITLKDQVFQIDLAGQNSSQKWFNDYAELFNDELGSLPVTYHMKLDQNVTPVVRPPSPHSSCYDGQSEGRVREHGETRSYHTHLRTH